MTTTTATTTWTVDTVHSTANFAVKHFVVATFRGSFDDVGGTLDLRRRAAPDRRGRRPEHPRQGREPLRPSAGPGLLRPADTPQITFVSTAVARDGTTPSRSTAT